MRLQIGDLVEVFGWVMLKKMEHGKIYRLSEVTQHAGKDVYWFTRPRGTKKIVGHYASDVDMVIGYDCYNRIEVINRQDMRGIDIR